MPRARATTKQIAWADVFNPLRGEPGSDLMLLHPDGSEEVLVAAGDGAIADPFVSFDGEWVYYARFHDVKQPGSTADVAELRHLQDPRQDAADRAADAPGVHAEHRRRRGQTSQRPGVYNLGPCPLPGGKVVFTSNRNGFAARTQARLHAARTLQLFVMDDDGSNVEKIGHLNVGSALHPAILKDGRVMFSTLESQGLRDLRLWAIWSIHPDGTNWEPLVSAFGHRATPAFHFQTQLSDGSIVVEEYYNLNNRGFGTYFKLAAAARRTGAPPFGPASARTIRATCAYNGSRLLPHAVQPVRPGVC